MMSPVVSALTELQKEVSAVIECAVEADGPRVTIYFGTRSERLGLNDHSIKIESWGTDTRFQLEVERMGFYGGRAREYMFDTAEEVVQFVVDAAAERVASCEFHSEK